MQDGKKPGVIAFFHSTNASLGLLYIKLGKATLKHHQPSNSHHAFSNNALETKGCHNKNQEASW